MLRLLLQLGGAASMAYIAIEVAIAAVREYQEEGRTARAWRDATELDSKEGQDGIQEPVDAPGVNRGGDRDSGAGVRDLRGNGPERGPGSRD